jgi:hypothetical protein
MLTLIARSVTFGKAPHVWRHSTNASNSAAFEFSRDRKAASWAGMKPKPDILANYILLM